MLLQGSIDKVNQRTLQHLGKLSADLAELGARYNGFSLSEQSPSVASAIERTGQAVDTTYLSTEDLSNSLGASFSEPMRESAQFAGVVRSVLRYRVLKRVQQEMTRDQLDQKKGLLSNLERSEEESKRIDAYLTQSTANLPQRSASSASARNSTRVYEPPTKPQTEETQSIDSDFPPTHSEAPSSPPSAAQGPPQSSETPMSPTNRHQKTQSGNFVTNKIFGSFRHAVNGFVDSDPERTRRDQMGKTKDSLTQLEQALEVSEKDVRDATQGVMKDLKRFQKEKEEDLTRYMVSHDNTPSRWGFTNRDNRSHMQNVTSSGRGRTWRRGVRLGMRLIRLWRRRARRSRFCYALEELRSSLLQLRYQCSIMCMKLAGSIVCSLGRMRPLHITCRSADNLRADRGHCCPAGSCDNERKAIAMVSSPNRGLACQ